MGIVRDSLRRRNQLIRSLDPSEAILTNQLIDDSLVAQKNIAKRIKSLKEHLKLAKGQTKKLLLEQLEEQENQWFQLHRDSYINSCKRGSILSLDALAKIPGFKGDVLYKEYVELEAKREKNRKERKDKKPKH